MAVSEKIVINGHDYTKYVKAKTGFSWSRINTNDEDAGRDSSDTMHTNVLSHQRELTFTLGPMPFSAAQQLESDLQGNDDGVRVRYPDLCDGMCTRLFYNTSITAAMETFTEEGVMCDNVKFTLISVKEDTV